MTRPASHIANMLRIALRAALILLVLAAPVLAVPQLRGDAGNTIEAPAARKNGVGFVLLVSLQRA
ncbi:MAG: hypothetical protein LCH86_15480 [Proteobacteria bacterium]|nr:hypothetical protein [Pseudomonadota bacterium]